MQQNQVECVWKRGQPTKFHSGLLEDYVNKRALGWSDCRIAASWFIAESTLSKWKKEENKFEDVLELGKTLYRAWWEEKGYKMVTGEEKGNMSAWAMHMNTQHGWANPNQTSASGDTIHINNVNMLSFDKKENDKMLADMMEKHKALSLDDLKVKLIESDGHK